MGTNTKADSQQSTYSIKKTVHQREGNTDPRDKLRRIGIGVFAVQSCHENE